MSRFDAKDRRIAELEANGAWAIRAIAGHAKIANDAMQERDSARAQVAGLREAIHRHMAVHPKACPCPECEALTTALAATAPKGSKP